MLEGTLPPSSTVMPHSPAALRVAAARAGWRAARLRVLDRCRRHAPLEQPAAEVKETSLGIVGHPDRVRSSAPQLLRDGRLLGPHGLLQVRAVHSLAPHCGCDETRGGSRVTQRDTTRYDEIRRSLGDRRRSEEIGGDRRRSEEGGVAERCGEMRSIESIRGTQRHSEALRGTQGLLRGYSGATRGLLRGAQRHSEAHRSNSGALRVAQRHPEAPRGTQRHSEALPSSCVLSPCPPRILWQSASGTSWHGSFR